MLFFDNSTMDFGDQARARQAATKFIDTNGGPNRLMAIANFGGALQIAQNFTEDPAAAEECRERDQVFRRGAQCIRCERARQMNTQMASFGSRDVLYALKDLAKSLSSIPGRKTVILITGGFPLTPEIMSEATAVISACNKSNVAIYPIDVRGLVAATPQASLTAPDGGVAFCSGVLSSGWHGFLYSATWRRGAGGGGGGRRRRRRWSGRCAGGGAPTGGAPVAAVAAVQRLAPRGGRNADRAEAPDEAGHRGTMSET